MSLYRLRGARVRFGDGTVVALPDLRLEPGERLGVLGPNGAGKTTLLRVLAFLETPAGEFKAAVDPAHVAFVAQRPYLFRDTAAANVALAVRGAGRAERRRRALVALEQMGAAHLAERQRDTLSAGELQRVALARALAAAPRVLLLDEPCGPLDTEGVARLEVLLGTVGEATIVAAAPTPQGLPLGASLRQLLLPA